MLAKALFALFLISGALFAVGLFKGFPRGVNYFLGATCLLSFLVVIGLSQKERKEAVAEVPPLSKQARQSKMGGSFTEEGLNRGGDCTSGVVARMMDDPASDPLSDVY